MFNFDYKIIMKKANCMGSAINDFIILGHHQNIPYKHPYYWILLKIACKFNFVLIPIDIEQSYDGFWWPLFL